MAETKNISYGAVVSDELTTMFDSLSKLDPKVLSEAVERFLGGFEGFAQLVRFDVDRDPTGASDFRIVLKPADCFFDLAAAVAL